MEDIIYTIFGFMILTLNKSDDTCKKCGDIMCYYSNNFNEYNKRTKLNLILNKWHLKGIFHKVPPVF